MPLKQSLGRRQNTRIDVRTKYRKEGPLKMHIKILINLTIVVFLQASSIHWSIDWNSQTNLVSSSYLSKELLPRLIKLDNILKTRINALDDEVDQNFLILIIITGLMVIILALAAHTCYLSCKQKIDNVVPPKPAVSRIPVIQESHLPVIKEQVTVIAPKNQKNDR